MAYVGVKCLPDLRHPPPPNRDRDNSCMPRRNGVDDGGIFSKMGRKTWNRGNSYISWQNGVDDGGMFLKVA